MLRFLFWLLLFAVAITAWLIWGRFRRALLIRRIDRARQDFTAHRAAFDEQFRVAAGATGKPRGLAWKKCELHGPLILARDRANGELIGLIAVTISFEALEGGGMEDVAAVGNLRAATAVFHWNSRGWTTQGRAVFNLEPREVLDRYADSLDPVHTEHVTV
jgi:hypothetical protein